MLLQLIYGIIGIALLYYGAEYLVRGGVRIAEALHVPSIVIGLTLVAFATSAPELVVSIDASLKGSGDISLGNVIGSNISNIGLILGLSALIAPMGFPRELLRFDMPMLIVATGMLTGFCHFGHGISRLQAALLLAAFIFYMWKTVMGALKGRPGGNGVAAPEEGSAESTTKPTPIYLALLFALGGILALVGGAKLFVNASIYIARLFHVSDAVIGLTIVAVGTSLPELATSVVAAFKGENEIAIGNVIGSNLFNILSILGIAPLIRPISAVGILPLDLAMVCFFTLLMLIMMLARKIIMRWEGLLLFASYIGYMALLVWRSVGAN